jgi:hypothetical protein
MFNGDVCLASSEFTCQDSQLSQSVKSHALLQAAASLSRPIETQVSSSDSSIQLMQNGTEAAATSNVSMPPYSATSAKAQHNGTGVELAVLNTTILHSQWVWQWQWFQHGGKRLPGGNRLMRTNVSDAQQLTDKQQMEGQTDADSAVEDKDAQREAKQDAKRRKRNMFCFGLSMVLPIAFLLYSSFNSEAETGGEVNDGGDYWGAQSRVGVA